MKVNAPKKIYLTKNLLGELFDGWDALPSNNPIDIEYTRTDAFIEKACAWIKESVTNNPECNRIISKKGVITIGLLIDDFRKYMEE